MLGILLIGIDITLIRIDIGVGSGCIILSILNEKPGFYGKGIDICSKSIRLSELNAMKLSAENRVKFIKTNVDNFCHRKYDLIISNPPYIKSNKIKYLEKDVCNFEPRLALDGGLDGLSGIKKVVRKSSELIKNHGKLILEIAHDQKEEVIRILRGNNFYVNKIMKDFANKDRCIISTKI